MDPAEARTMDSLEASMSTNIPYSPFITATITSQTDILLIREHAIAIVIIGLYVVEMAQMC